MAGGHCVQCPCTSAEHGGRSSVKCDSKWPCSPVESHGDPSILRWRLPTCSAAWQAQPVIGAVLDVDRDVARDPDPVSAQSGSRWLRCEVTPCGGNARSTSHIGRAGQCLATALLSSGDRYTVGRRLEAWDVENRSSQRFTWPPLLTREAISLESRSWVFTLSVRRRLQPPCTHLGSRWFYSVWQSRWGRIAWPPRLTYEAAAKRLPKTNRFKNVPIASNTRH